MAFAQLHFFSEAVGTSTSLYAILPSTSGSSR